MNSKKVERKVKCWTCGKVRKKSNNYICKNCNEKRQAKGKHNETMGNIQHEHQGLLGRQQWQGSHLHDEA